MKLFERFQAECVELVKVRVPDSEGGWIKSWTDGPSFMAAIVLDSNADTLTADAEGSRGTFTMTTSAVLGFHRAFRRVSDGRTFRVVGVKDPAPEAASFAFSQYTVEEWEPADDS